MFLYVSLNQFYFMLFNIVNYLEEIDVGNNI